MSGFRSRLNRLGSDSDSTSKHSSFLFEHSFETEYYFEHRWRRIVVKPILVNDVVIFLVNFPVEFLEPIALVYNERDSWSDIEKECTGRTASIGASIEQYYSTRLQARFGDVRERISELVRNNYLLN